MECAGKLSEIIFFGNGPLMDSVLVELAKKYNYQLDVNSLGPGSLRFNTVPDLTTAHKTIVQKILDANGYGKITP